ncbi:hypothetical protein C8R44DRAFT_776770, partial [Mycena epipterygia]
MDDDETSEEPIRHPTRSLSLFGKMSNLDLTALIRSSSLTSRRISANEDKPHTRRRSRKVALDYVKQEMDSDADVAILNVISHSRSRSHSQSKGGEEAAETVAVPTLPGDAEPEPQSTHNPSTLLQSRHLSAATTTTASTVTPANVTPRKRAPPRIPIAPVQEEAVVPPKQAQVQVAPKKNFHIFGIPLPSPRKTSFGSRPTTPSEASPAPVRSLSPRRGAASPTPTGKSKLAKPKAKPDTGVGPTPPSRLDNLSKFFVGTGMRVSSNPEPARAVAPTSKPSNATPSKIPTLKSHKPTMAHISPSTVVADPATPKPAAKQPGRRHMSEVGNTARVREPVTPTPAPRIPSSSASSVGGSTARLRVSATSAASTAHIRSTISNPRASIVGSRTSATGSALAPTLTPRVRTISTG